MCPIKLAKLTDSLFSKKLYRSISQTDYSSLPHQTYMMQSTSTMLPLRAAATHALSRGSLLPRAVFSLGLAPRMRMRVRVGVPRGFAAASYSGPSSTSGSANGTNGKAPLGVSTFIICSVHSSHFPSLAAQTHGDFHNYLDSCRSLPAIRHRNRCRLLWTLRWLFAPLS